MKTTVITWKERRKAMGNILRKYTSPEIVGYKYKCNIRFSSESRNKKLRINVLRYRV